MDTSSATSVDKKEDVAVTDTNLVDTSTDTSVTKKVDTDVGVEDTTEAAYINPSNPYLAIFGSFLLGNIF